MTISDELLNDIENAIKSVEISYSDDSWRASLPSDPGWYFIETNAPPDEFLAVGPPKGERHYNLPEKAKASLCLKRFGVCMLPSQSPFYFVYSGEAMNIKARAREHLSGHPKTGCLALENYPSLHQYKWRFYYAVCSFGTLTS